MTKNSLSSAPSFFLAHTRLAVIDLSERANQPMVSHDNQYYLVFNGEIYNYAEIRKDLEKKGYPFRTTSDTEVLLNLYIEEKEAMLAKLDGMFSFVIVDLANECLFAARDRFGEKPFYYSYNNGTFSFASTLSSFVILEDSLPREVNEKALTSFLAWGEIDHPDTLLKNIFRLPPGTCLRVNRTGISQETYWKPRVENYLQADEEEILRHYRTLLASSIQSRLIADVPAGLLLSGGIDSSLITALASQLGSKPSTFTVRYAACPERDEGEFAQQVARQFGTDHHEIWLQEDSLNLLPAMIAELGEPTRNFNIFSTYALTKKISQSNKVLLSGDGADELNGGYDWNNVPFKRIRIDTPIEELQGLRLYEAAEKIPAFRDRGQQLLADMYGTFIIKRLIHAEESDWVLDQRLLPHYLELSKYFWKGMLSQFKKYNSFNQIILLDIKTHLANQILQPADRISMMNGVEMRMPFLNHKLLDFCFNIPISKRFEVNRPKHIVKQLASQFFPDSFVNRTKQGLYSPFPHWLVQNNQLKESVKNILLSKRFRDRGYVNPNFTQSLFYFDLIKDPTMKSKLITFIWYFLVLEIWHRYYIDQEEFDWEPITANAHPR